MSILPFRGSIPEVHESSFIAPTAYVTGKTFIAKDVSIFFGASLRGDILNIKVGEGSNIQDNAVIHTSKGLNDCIIGHGVTIGHSAIVHGAKINGLSIIGMGAILLDDAIIEEECIIGAASLVTMGTVIPKGHLAFGNPAKVIRKLTDKEIHMIHDTYKRYIEVGREYKNNFSLRE